MIKSILIWSTFFIFIFSSCVTSKITNVPNTTQIENFEKDRVEILGNVEGKSVGIRVWVLFIPLGWAKNSWVEGHAYKKSLKVYPQADGIIDQVKTFNKTTIPLVVITPQVKIAKVKGTAYHIRTDIELENYLKSKKQ